MLEKLIPIISKNLKIKKEKLRFIYRPFGARDVFDIVNIRFGVQS